MVAPVAIDSSSGWACTRTIRLAATGECPLTVTWTMYARVAARGPGGPIVAHRSGTARHHGRMEYPELAARTRRFSYGAPRAVSVASDGNRVAFLRSTGPEDPAHRLHVFHLAVGQHRLAAAPWGLLADPGQDLPPQERAAAH